MSDVVAQFGANAANYASSPVHAAGESLGLLVELVRPRSDWRALDVATGAGHTALAFAPLVDEVTASDMTPAMLVQVRKLAEQRQVSNIATVEAAADRQPFADDTFDLVTCRIAAHHFPSVGAFLTECRRVLKPGGTLGIVDNIAPDITTTPGYSREDLDDAARAYNAFEKRRDPSHGRALTAREWSEAVAQAGFGIVDERILLKPMAFELWCRNMSVPSDIKVELADTLEGMTGAVAAFLSPSGPADARTFVLREWVAVATMRP